MSKVVDSKLKVPKVEDCQKCEVLTRVDAQIALLLRVVPQLASEKYKAKNSQKKNSTTPGTRSASAEQNCTGKNERACKPTRCNSPNIASS